MRGRSTICVVVWGMTAAMVGLDVAASDQLQAVEGTELRYATVGVNHYLALALHLSGATLWRSEWRLV